MGGSISKSMIAYYQLLGMVLLPQRFLAPFPSVLLGGAELRPLTPISSLFSCVPVSACPLIPLQSRAQYSSRRLTASDSLEGRVDWLNL